MDRGFPCFCTISMHWDQQREPRPFTLIRKSAGLLASGSFYSPRLPDRGRSVAFRGFRSRSQRPDRNGFTPFSLLGHTAMAPIFY